MTSVLNDEYRTLLHDLTTLLEADVSVLAGPVQADRRRVSLYWQMGRRIVEVVQRGKERGAYGQQVLRQLSIDLSEKYGHGFKERTVQYIRRFALQYDRDALRSELGWSQYRVLIHVDDAKRRRALEERAVEDHLTKDQLQLLIRQETSGNDKGHVFPLQPREGSPGIFKVVFDPQSNRPLLDLGFSVTRDQPIRGIRDLKDGDHVVQDGEKFTRVDCAPGARYCYRGSVLKVIDGDTVKMRIDLGFGMRIDESMRLRGVDAAELNTEEGRKAHRALERLLKNAGSIAVLTWSHDRYGRYIADLVCDGVYLNKTLVEKGAARFLKM